MNGVFDLGVPLEIVLAVAALAGFGAAVPLVLPAGRSAHYALSHATFALFLLVGPRALLVTLPVSVVVLLVHAVRGLRDVFRDLLTTIVALVLGVGVAHGVNAGFTGRYPLALDSLATLLEACCVLTIAYVSFAGLREVVHRRSKRTEAADTYVDLLEHGAPLYAFGALVTGPLQILALATYLHAGSWSWIVAICSALVAYALIPHESRKVSRLRALLAERAARERVEAISEVTTRVAHQMRHQLGLIGLSLRRIDAHLPDAGTEDARIVREELENLLRAQEELRAVLSDDLQRVHEDDARTTWRSLLTKSTSRVALLARERNVRLEVELGVLPDSAPRHASRFEQAWFNILENAVSAARSEVVVRSARDDASLVLSVDDDGPGMSDEVLARATEPFFTTKADGTGMGLAIARAVAEDLGGALVLDRRERGMRVSLRVPFADRDALRARGNRA